jgi:hypothetical protein
MTAASTSKNFQPAFVKSHYNLGTCEGCGKEIKRGDSITEVCEHRGMVLRYRSHVNGDFYLPNTGNRYVHIDCTIEDEDGAYWTMYKGEMYTKRNWKGTIGPIADNVSLPVENEDTAEQLPKTQHTEDEVVDAFAHLLDEPDYSEKISAERLFTLLAKEEYGLTKEELKMVKNVAEIDDDGLVDYRELSKIFLK